MRFWQAGGWNGLKQQILTNMGKTGDNYFHMWSTTGHFADNPMGVHWTGIVLGLGFVISFISYNAQNIIALRKLTAVSQTGMALLLKNTADSCRGGSA